MSRAWMIGFLLLAFGACDSRSVGSDPGQDSGVALPDAAVPDGQVEVPPAPPVVSFVRGQNNPGSAGLHVLALDQREPTRLDLPLGEGCQVDAHLLSRHGGVCREACYPTNGPQVRYHAIQSDGSVIRSSGLVGWVMPRGDQGLTRAGDRAWFHADGELVVVELSTRRVTTYEAPELLAVEPGGRWAVTGTRTQSDLTARGVDLEGGGAVDLHRFGQDLQPLYPWAFDLDEELAYVGAGRGDIWAVSLDGREAWSLVHAFGVSGGLKGRIEASGELLAGTQDSVYAFDPVDGQARFTASLAGAEVTSRLSPGGAFHASVGYTTEEGMAVQIVETGTGAVRQVSIAPYIEHPWNCCCGGPDVGELAFHEQAGLLAVPIVYGVGMCACLCDEEVVPPEEADLRVALIDLRAGSLLAAVPHNGVCDPGFSPDGTLLAFCDNDLHIPPMPGGYLKSAVAVYVMDTGETVRLTDQDHDDRQARFVR